MAIVELNRLVDCFWLMGLQMTAAGVLRERVDWGQTRRWEGNYLARAQDNPDYSLFVTSVNNLKNVDRFSVPLFSSFIRKTNRFHKMARRALLVTDTNIYKLDAHKFKSMKKGLLIQEVFTNLTQNLINIKKVCCRFVLPWGINQRLPPYIT